VLTLIVNLDNRTYFINSKTIQRAITFLHALQQPEGGWVGSWGICFTYATMFALESLSLVGETYETSESASRACDFLVSKQRADGGWGESYKVRYFLLNPFERDVIFGTDMRGMCMDRTRKYPSRPNVLGSTGTHAREVP
jgi:squalene cyclase